jgi:DNA topoisomerase-1
LERAVELLAEARTSNTVLRELGAHPDDQKPVEVCNGRYGPYVRHGKVNATLPKDISPEEVTLPEALTLLAERVAKGPSLKKGAAKKKVTATKKVATKKKVAAPKKVTATKKVATKKKVADPQ